jgi:phosphate transport system protein
MTRAKLDKALQELDTQTRRLGSLVEHTLAQALEALEMGDQDKAGAVIALDTPIGDLRLIIEEQTFRILALQRPLSGRDLRYLTLLVPMAVDLERIGEEALVIAQNVLRIIPFRAEGIREAEARTQQVQEENSLIASGSEGDQCSEASIMRCILDLGQMVRSLLQETMQAFASRDTEAARRLWEEDKVVGRGASMVRREVMAMLEDLQVRPAPQHGPYTLQHATCLLWVTDELERVADYCINICERIVFIVQGEIDIYPRLEQ